jgi:hypothetical protein
MSNAPIVMETAKLVRGQNPAELNGISDSLDGVRVRGEISPISWPLPGKGDFIRHVLNSHLIVGSQGADARHYRGGSCHRACTTCSGTRAGGIRCGAIAFPSILERYLITRCRHSSSLLGACYQRHAKHTHNQERESEH